MNSYAHPKTVRFLRSLVFWEAFFVSWMWLPESWPVVTALLPAIIVAHLPAYAASKVEPGARLHA